MHLTYALGLLTLALGLAYLFAIPGRRAKSLPHGPPTLPVLGNLHQIPPRKTYIKLAEWAKEYGEMYSLKVASDTTVVISSRRLVREIMDKRNSVSGHRPKPYAVEKLIYKGDFLLLMNSTDARWRVGRKFFHQFFMESMVERQHMPFISAESTQLMRDLLIDPKNFADHSKRYANSFIMSVTYGVRTPNIKTPHFVKINHITETMTEIVMPGRLPPVDIFPFLRWIPERFLGNWKSRCQAMQRESDALYGELMQLVIDRRSQKGPRDTYADRLIEQQDKLGFTWHELMYMTGVVIDAGTDTTSSAFITLVQIFTTRPDLQRIAQEQIDAAIGDDRTPNWDDFVKLPIVNQLMKEVQRFHPVVPIAFPHLLSEDIVVDGKSLPKGTSIIANLSGLHHDDTKFPNANAFDPSHYADKSRLASEYANLADYEARDHYGYGFGRRLCPGIHLAERSLFITFAKLLWGFEITPAKDSTGKDVVVDLDPVTGYTDGAIILPEKFDCNIKIRSEKKKETLLREFTVAEQEIFSQFELPPQNASVTL